MKNKSIIISSILFFLLFNTSFLWQKLPGLWDLGIIAVLVIAFLALAVVLLVQFTLLIFGKFKSKKKNISTAVLAFVLLITVIFPFGVYNPNHFEEPNLIFARLESTANCTSSLKIRKENRFSYTSVCFGFDDYNGTYEIVGDTIKLLYDDKSPFNSKVAYGIVELDSVATDTHKGTLWYHRSLEDEKPMPLAILEYDL
ncbi:hypothetical protein [Botryobacter ruber]|uniref:hypothetical protein n=1 Tax=Botryobacter ruber TaxID=2171629 RepID=UPI000F6504FE|nr:hypothetical protein [Botryobacter ruber]